MTALYRATFACLCLSFAFAISCGAHNSPLTVRGVEVVKVEAGPSATFDLKSWTGPTGKKFEVNVADGKMTRSDQP
jgi:hypothetical protein